MSFAAVCNDCIITEYSGTESLDIIKVFTLLPTRPHAPVDIQVTSADLERGRRLANRMTRRTP